MKKAVWLDRDGVLNADTGYVYRIKDCTILPGVIAGLGTLAAQGFDLFVISNQSGVARALYNEEDVIIFHEHLDAVFKQSGIFIKEFAYCPHHPSSLQPHYAIDCACRKPKTGMLLKNIKNYEIIRSYLVGDRGSDMECAANAGLKGVLIESEYAKTHSSAVVSVKNFTEAVDWIIHDCG